VRLVVCALASLPAGWLAGVLFQRVPVNHPLFRPLPRPQFTGVFATMHVVTTGLFVMAALRFEDVAPLQLAAYLLFFTAVVALSAIDLDTLRLPDRIVGGALVVSIPLVTLASVLTKTPEQLRYALIGGVFYFGFLLLTHLAFPRGMGFGDVKLAALLGLYVGWLATDGAGAASLVLYAMIVGFVGGSVVGVVLFSFRRKSKPYPFGPFLMAGAVAVIAFTPQLLPG
jgi:leader peptidase (prepilin peptidase) / N-methyltransferase